MKKPGRFRKGKKASRNAEAFPLWWSGSAKQRKLQLRYFVFLLVKDWKKEVALCNVKMMLLNISSAYQLAAIRSTPRPMDVSPQEWAKQKSVRIVEHLIDSGLALTAIQFPPKPTAKNYVKSAFTTIKFESNPQKNSWLKESFLIQHGVWARVENKIQVIPGQA